DRGDVPFNAARSLRYLDRFLLVSQGEVFYATEVLARLEGMQRGPAGNTSLAAALALARDLPADATVVVQETKYTRAGKHAWAQLRLAAANGIEVRNGRREENRPGSMIAIPSDVAELGVDEVDLAVVRESYLARALRDVNSAQVEDVDVQFLADET